MAETTVRGLIGDREISLSAGKLAQLADGAVGVQVGGTQVLVSATSSRRLREGTNFFPLTVDIEERMYAVGRIPGSFFRREGRATEKATLTARLIDRPLRPSFVDGFLAETHVVATVLSADLVNPYDVAALNAASAALTISPMPFLGPIGGVRMALRDGEWIPFPTYDELAESVFELVVAGKRNADGEVDVAMVEAGATENGLRLVQDGQPPSDEEAVARGLEEAKAHIAVLIDLQLELLDSVGAPTEVEWPLVFDYSEELYERVAEVAAPKIAQMGAITDKQERLAAEQDLKEATIAELGIDDDAEEELKAAHKAFRTVQKKVMRERVVADGVRMDGRGLTDIRDLSIEVGLSRGGARFGPVPARRDPGPQRDHPWHAAHGGDARHDRHRGVEALHASLQLPAVFDRRDGGDARAEAARDRARSPRREGAAAGHPPGGGLSLRLQAGLGRADVQRLEFDGIGLRVVAVPHGRRASRSRLRLPE